MENLKISDKLFEDVIYFVLGNLDEEVKSCKANLSFAVAVLALCVRVCVCLCERVCVRLTGWVGARADRVTRAPWQMRAIKVAGKLPCLCVCVLEFVLVLNQLIFVLVLLSQRKQHIWHP